MCQLTAKTVHQQLNRSTGNISIDTLPDRVTDNLDLYSLKAIEKYLDKSKGKAILTPAKFEEWRDIPC